MKNTGETPNLTPNETGPEDLTRLNEATNLVSSWERSDLGYYQNIGHKQVVLSEVGGSTELKSAYVENDIEIKSDRDSFEKNFRASLSENPEAYDSIEDLFEQRLVFVCYYLAGRCNAFFGRGNSEKERAKAFEEYMMEGENYAVRPLSSYKDRNEAMCLEYSMLSKDFLDAYEFRSALITGFYYSPSESGGHSYLLVENPENGNSYFLDTVNTFSDGKGGFERTAALRLLDETFTTSSWVKKIDSDSFFRTQNIATGEIVEAYG